MAPRRTTLRRRRSAPAISMRCSTSARESSPRQRPQPRREARAGGQLVSGRLKLRRGVIVATDPLTIEVEGERRPAWADEALLGEMREGDEVVVNVAALDLGLGSGGFDLVHV